MFQPKVRMVPSLKKCFLLLLLFYQTHYARESSPQLYIYIYWCGREPVVVRYDDDYTRDQRSRARSKYSYASLPLPDVTRLSRRHRHGGHATNTRARPRTIVLVICIILSNSMAATDPVVNRCVDLLQILLLVYAPAALNWTSCFCFSYSARQRFRTFSFINSQFSSCQWQGGGGINTDESDW